MSEVRWELYPLVAQLETARTWLRMQANLQLAPKTIDAYGRCLNDFLAFCSRQHLVPEALTREQVALYVQDLASRPNPGAATILSLDSGFGLSLATMQQRLTVVRLFCDYLVEQQLRQDTPLSRGHYVPGREFAGAAARGVLRRQERLPWIPSDQQWQDLLAYDGALRREELVTLQIGDFDYAYRQIRVRAAHAKNGRERIVGYGTIASRLLQAYLQHRYALSPAPGPLFLSESHRNRAQPLSLVMWSKAVQKIANRTDLPRFTTHTPRHLRLTHLARARMDLHQIAIYAGHSSLHTTMRYIHLSGVEVTEAVQRSLAGFEHWMEAVLGEEKP